jgi:hypothetical protein
MVHRFDAIIKGTHDSVHTLHLVNNTRHNIFERKEHEEATNNRRRDWEPQLTYEVKYFSHFISLFLTP